MCTGSSNPPYVTRKIIEFRPPASPVAEVGIVAELRSWLPPEIGGVLWVSMMTPCTGMYVPWYIGTRRFPKPYQTGTNVPGPGSAYWSINRLAAFADESYKDRIGSIAGRWATAE